MVILELLVTKTGIVISELLVTKTGMVILELLVTKTGIVISELLVTKTGIVTLELLVTKTDCRAKSSKAERFFFYFEKNTLFVSKNADNLLTFNNFFLLFPDILKARIFIIQ